MPEMIPRALWLAAAAALAIVALAACGTSSGAPNGAAGSGGGSTGAGSRATHGPGSGKPPITIGDKNFTEEFLLGELYGQALEAKGFTVRLKPNIGSSELIDTALTSHKIDMYPEYTGEIVLTIAHQKRKPNSEAQTYADAQRFERSRGFQLLAPTPFYDKNNIAVLPSFAARHHLHSIADLVHVGHDASGITYGDFPENRTRYAGLVGLKSAYGLKAIHFKGLSNGLELSALSSGAINVGDVGTTQGLATKLTILTDPRHIFGFQNAAPVVSPGLMRREGPAFRQTLDAVSAHLTIPAMRAMNTAVDVSKLDVGDVAHTFLAANGLVPR